ncbi:MAG: hypothetical protein EXS67_06130 [Candidatus Margulisbacteria bacterium]|nr:hypothetical protein [Candidatus Margulisiibacteriota bacterium]
MKLRLLLLAVLLGSLPVLYAENVSVENEFIKFVVNNGPEDLGRFAIETTGGDPKNLKDNNQSLIYGQPVPWTSYTTVRIDGRDFVFGGQGHRLSQRSGQPITFGTVVSQAVKPSSIVTVCRFKDVLVTQTLSFIRNASTKVMDTAQISYSAVNEGTIPHDVGIRIMMDTKLGSNDGAPFRIGTQAGDAEQIFEGGALFDYWQAFDDLVSPNVIAQGTIYSSELGIAKPDKLYLANWGTLSDYPWEFPYEQGRSFIRAGEAEKDTALAMYWNPTTLAPQKTLHVSTLYGLGGLTVSPGLLSLGLTAPAEIHSSSKRPFLMMSYIANSGGYDSQNTIVTFTLPEGFSPVNGKRTFKLGTLHSGETRQIPMKIELDNPPSGIKTLKVSVQSDTLESNALSRKIDVLSPPRIISKLRVPTSKIASINAYTDVVVYVTNPTTHTLHDIDAEIKLSDPASLAGFEVPKKSLRSLRPNQTVLLHWKINLNTSEKKSVPISVSLDSSATKADLLQATIQTGPASFSEHLSLSDSNVDSDSFFFTEFSLYQAPSLLGETYQILYNPEELTLLRVSDGARFIDQPSVYSDTVTKTPGRVEIADLNTGDSLYRLDVCKLHFRTKKSGSSLIQLMHEDKVIETVTVNIDTQNKGDSE